MNIILTIFEGLLVGWIATIIFEFILKTNKKLRTRYYYHHEILFGHHVHHSTYGLILLAVGAILYFNNNLQGSIFYISAGIGIIIEHTLSDGRFIFIEKVKNK